MRIVLILAVLLVLLFALGHDAMAKPPARDKRPPLSTKAEIDLARYMGRWWVIANIPYFAEKGKVESADVYALRADGRIDNTFVYRKDFDHAVKDMKGLAEVVPGTNNAQWRIAFLGGLVKVDYLVLEVAPDYSWALIGHPKRKLGWIFAREQDMGDEQYQLLLAKMEGYGYDTTQFRRVPQKAEQQGQPGFQ